MAKESYHSAYHVSINIFPAVSALYTKCSGPRCSVFSAAYDLWTELTRKD